MRPKDHELNPPQNREKWKPAYQKLAEKGELEERVELAYQKLTECDLCPHSCGINRLEGERGLCNNPDRAVVHSAQPHYGEEIPLVGGSSWGRRTGGSGTIFFSNCNLRCVFCQNWPTAHEGRGTTVEDEELAEMMLDLQERGCHNINLVTPTHVVPQILRATRMALNRGLHLPLCYNTGGYESRGTIELLDGIVDIYLADLKFMDGEEARRYTSTGASDYPRRARQAIKTAYRQVGDLVTDSNGIALRGLMIRHLVMPNEVSGTREHERISRSVTSQEFARAVKWAREAGLKTTASD